MLRLRLSEGLSLTDYKKRFGRDFVSGREDAIKKYLRHELISIDGDNLALTPRGLYLSNSVLADLI